MDVDHGLIGRGAAVATLHQALHRARRGAPTVLGIQSAPGMGKTTLVRSFVGRLGRDVARFSCTAQSELTVPFLPLASLLDGLGIVRRQRLPQATELEPEVDLELFGEVAGAILTIARERTVVLALDDVQWVDDATCRLLSFVSTSLADHAIDGAVQVLAILTARRSISGAPATFFDRMTGGPDGRLVTLEPLDETSVAELVWRRTGRRLSPSDARGMAEATGGNPLLVELVADQDRDTGAPLRLPTSMSDEIERKLRALPDGVRDVLEVGALQGDPFDVPTVETVLGLAHVDDAVAVAQDAGIIVTTPGGRGFRHPELARHVRLSMDGSRRAQLHTALALAAYANNPGSDADLIADAHFRRGDGSADLRLRLSTAVRAGQRALSHGAWARAVDAFEFVGAHFDTLQSDDDERAAIALDVATAFIMDDQPAAAQPFALLALELADRMGATDVRGQAALRCVRNRLSGHFHDGGEWPELDRLREVAEAGEDVATRVHAWVTLADVAFVRRDQAEGRRCSEMARELAEQSGDDQLRAWAHYAEGLQRLGRLDVHGAHESLSRSQHLAEQRSIVHSWALVRRPIAEFVSGDLVAASSHTDRAIAHTTDRRQWADRSLAEAYRACILALRGEFSEAESCATAALRLYRRTGYDPTVAITLPELICIRTVRGDEHPIDVTVERDVPDDARLPTWIAALADRTVGAQGTMRRVEHARAPVATLTSLLGLVARAELSTGASAEHTAKLGTELLRAFDAGAVWTAGWAISTPRALATVATSLGQPDEARRWLAIAGTLAEQSGAITEQVQVWIREAELDRSTDGAAGAMRASRNCLRAMRTADSIGARALSAMAAHALDVGGEVDVDDAPLFERTILFTDVVGSTPLNVEVGDHRFVALLDEHNEVLRRAADERGGVVFHNTGDGYGVWFTNPADAVACAGEMHRRLALLGSGTIPIRVRIGIATGRPLSLDGDLFGIDVVRGSRVCGLVGAGETAIDATSVARAGRPLGRSLGLVSLKGIPEPEEVFVLRAS